MSLILAICAFAAISSPADLPLTPPAGWKSERQDKAMVYTAPEAATGKFYVVMATAVEGKAGSIAELLDAGRKMVAEIGTFKSAADVKRAKSDGGWDNEFVLGSLESKDRAMLVLIMAVKKGDEGGSVIVLSDSVETMTKYADSFAAMIQGLGAEPAKAGVVDLQYAVPDGWTKTQVNGFPLLVKEKNEEYTKYRVSLLIFPTENIGKSIREQFVGYWNSFVTPNYTTKIAPIPLVSRMKSGHACAFDAEWDAKDKNGGVACVAIYMIAHGGKVVPVMGIFSGTDWTSDKTIETDVAAFLDTAKIPGATNEKVMLFDAANLSGEWSESSTAYANYVTRAGVYAGDATISTAAYFTLGSDGTYMRTLMAVGAAGNIREKDSGTWSVDDDELVLSKGARYSLLGYGADPKVGRFMVLGNYSNQKARLKFTNPRGILQAMWLRAK